MSFAGKGQLLFAALLAGGAAAQEPPPSDAPPAPEVVVTPAPTPEEQAEATKALADAKTAAPASAPAPRAGFVTGEGFRLLSEDGETKLRVGFQGAASYQPTFLPGADNWSSFKVPFARLRVDGTIYRKWLRYWFSFEFAQFPPFLLDGYLEAQPWAGFGIRLGQIYTPISRHEYLGPQEILFPEWALVADYFWTGRDKGLQFFGETDYLNWYVGFYAGSYLRTTVTQPGQFQLMGRLSATPLGAIGWGEIPWIMGTGPVPFRFMLSLEGYWNYVTPTSTGFNPSDGFYQRTDGPQQHQGAVAGELEAQWGRFALYSEFYARRIEAASSPTPAFWQLGWWGQANFTFYQRVLDASIRVNWINPDLSLPSDQFVSFEGQLAWYIWAPYVSLKLRYAIGHQQDPGPAPGSDPNFFKLVQQPLSTVGTGHLVTLQANLYF